MKHKSILFYLLALIGILVAASMLSAMSAPGVVPNAPAAAALQDTVVAPTLPIAVTPPVVVITGTAAVPVTGGEPLSTSWLFIAILVVAGLAFLVAVIALMRRPYP